MPTSSPLVEDLVNGESTLTLDALKDTSTCSSRLHGGSCRSKHRVFGVSAVNTPAAYCQMLADRTGESSFSSLFFKFDDGVVGDLAKP